VGILAERRSLKPYNLVEPTKRWNLNRYYFIERKKIKINKMLCEQLDKRQQD
jgi:hypothetical protein